jgi:hypothetical protein
LPNPEDCVERTSVKRHTDYAEFKAACKSAWASGDDKRTLTGCTSWGYSRRVLGPDTLYVAHIAPGNTHEFSTLQHEILHVLAMCTGLIPNGDPYHHDVRLWLGVLPIARGTRVEP